ncbi:hypothetical protein HP439_12985 [Sphingobacterium shayense]|uniref:hypothetical protein n=1 Tax=Sphingobacterium shayense TaxID=626343 RepID=UPI0015535539|nr:hypothetical protein [Sphingobacterium shayense]NQD71637.1 hypothetical protein [Sphingobacterium shayense]
MHRDYLHYLFTHEDGAFSVFRDSHMGRFICSLIRFSDFPVEQKMDDDKAVYFRLPRTSAMPSLFQRFCYLSTEDQRKINDHLIATFDLDFIEYYYVGKNLGLQQKVVIQNFILSRKLTSRIGETEQLKKRSYRKEEKEIKTMYERLSRRVRLQSAAIRKTIEEYQNIL